LDQNKFIDFLWFYIFYDKPSPCTSMTEREKASILERFSHLTPLHQIFLKKTYMLWENHNCERMTLGWSVHINRKDFQFQSTSSFCEVKNYMKHSMNMHTKAFSIDDFFEMFKWEWNRILEGGSMEATAKVHFQIFLGVCSSIVKKYIT
jgi:hypothetical protein